MPEVVITLKRRNLTLFDSSQIPLDGDILIEYNALRDAVSYGREGNSKDNLNAMVGALINYFIPPLEQAGYSLTGRPCRSIPNSKPKKAFPVHLLDAITSKRVFICIYKFILSSYVLILFFVKF